MPRRSTCAQAGSALWTPSDACSEGGRDRVTVVEVMCAYLPPEVIADRGHDEPRSLHDGGSVVLGADGSGGNDVALLELSLPVTRGAVVIVAVDHVKELVGRAKVDLDVPVVVAFAEVEAVTVDVAAPLFGRPAAVTVHDHTRVMGQPVLQFCLSCFVGGAGLLAVQ